MSHVDADTLVGGLLHRMQPSSCHKIHRGWALPGSDTETNP